MNLRRLIGPLIALSLAGIARAQVTIGITEGGTGQTTANAAFNALAPSQATHAGQILGTDGTNTSWVSAGGVGTVTHTVGALTTNAIVIGNGGGDINVLGSLGTTTTILHGNASGAPSFGAVVLTTDVSGILPGANGGTGNGFFAVSGPASTLKTFTFPNASDTVDTLAAAQTFAAAKTFPTSDIIMGGSSTGVTTFASANAGASNFTITYPAATGTVALTSGVPAGANPTATISGTAGTVTNGSALTFMRSDGAPALPAVITGITSINGNSVPTASDTFVLLAASQNLTNKTLTSPTIATGLTITPFNTAGILTNNASGVIASLSNASSASSVLLGLLGSGTPSSTTALFGDGTWKVPSGGGSPAGSNTYVQYNASGSFGANSGFTSDTSGNVTTLTITSTVATGTAPFTVTSTTTVANLSVNVANAGDYATGSFSPTLSAFTVVGGSGATATGHYTKIGNQVTVTVEINSNGGTIACVANSSHVGAIPYTTTVQQTGSYSFGDLSAGGQFQMTTGGSPAFYPTTWSATSQKIDLTITYLSI